MKFRLLIGPIRDAILWALALGLIAIVATMVLLHVMEGAS